MPPETQEQLQEQEQQQQQQQQQQSEAEAQAEAEAEFERGFNDVRGIKPPASQPERRSEPQAKQAERGAAGQETKQEAKQEQETKQEQEQQKDPWEGVPQIVRQTLERITSRLGSLDQLAHEVRSSTGRIAAIQSELARAAKAAASATQNAPTQSQIKDAMKAPEKWERIKQDFPEWAEAMEERLNFELSKLSKSPEIDVDGLKRDIAVGIQPTVASLIREAAAQAERAARQKALIDLKHEGWEETVRSKAFAEWLKAQPPELQSLAESEHARDAIRLLDEYEKHVRAVEDQKRKQERLRSAVPAKGSGAAAPPALSDEDAFLAGFNEVRGASL